MACREKAENRRIEIRYSKVYGVIPDRGVHTESVAIRLRVRGDVVGGIVRAAAAADLATAVAAT